MSNKVLVIGGSGYIGTVLIPKLIEKNHGVINVDNLLYNQFIENSYNPKKSNNYEEYQLNINDNETLKKIPPVDTVVILSGLVGDPICKKYPSIAQETNLISIKKIIDFYQKKNIKNLIFVSTCSNYGYIESTELAKEDHILNPISEYAKAKIEIENYLLDNRNTNNFAPTILRFSTAFGLSPRMRFDLTINHFTYEILKQREFDAFDVNTFRPYCHTQDLADSIILTLESKTNLIDHEVFNVGSNSLNFSKKNIIETIEKIIGKGKINYKENGSDARNYRVSFDKINRNLNFTTKYSIFDGIKECAEYIKNHRVDLIKTPLKYGNYLINNAS